LGGYHLVIKVESLLEMRVICNSSAEMVKY